MEIKKFRIHIEPELEKHKEIYRSRLIEMEKELNDYGISLACVFKDESERIVYIYGDLEKALHIARSIDGFRAERY